MAIIKATPKRGGGGHWYDAEAKPRHTMPLASGEGERNTTLRDARKYQLIPSVTTLLGLFAKPGLERWKQDQILRIAFDNPAKLDESFENYASRCLVLHEKPVEDAASFGTRIHDAIEKFFEGEPIEEELLPYVKPAFDWKQENQLRFIEREKTLVNLEEGFAGTVDIVGLGANQEKFVIDWKTRKTKPKQKVTSYDFQIHQIAAYAATYWGADAVDAEQVHGANAYLSSTEPGRFEVIKYSPAELKDAWAVFKSACAIWRSLKGYDPRQTQTN